MSLEFDMPSIYGVNEEKQGPDVQKIKLACLWGVGSLNIVVR